MRRILGGVFVMVLMGAPAAGQSLRPEGYVAGATGRWSNRFTSGSLSGVASGVDAFVTPYVAIEADGFLLGGGGMVLGLSPSAKLRFRRWAPKAVLPFVAGGYSFLQFFEGSSHAWNIGGGIDYAVSDSRGIRLEVRDSIRTNFPSHYLSVRVGVTFR